MTQDTAAQAAPTPKTSHTLRLRPEDNERIRTIQLELGLGSVTEAIRFALAIAAPRAVRLALQAGPDGESG